MRQLATAFVALGLALPVVTFAAQADTTPLDKTYAQSLVQKAVARHPELAVLEMHVTPPKAPDNIIIASNQSNLAEKSDADDLDVIKTGKSKFVMENGSQYHALLVLQDANKRPLGVLDAGFAYKAGDDKDALVKKATVVRDELARRISHADNLMEPAIFDPNVPTATYGQKLVDDALTANPDVVILALHTEMTKGAGYIISASNIGRVGKKADDDDMEVINTGVARLEINDTKDRFEVEQRLLNSAGQTIGAVGVVFPYKEGDNQEARHAEANKIVAALSKKIPNPESLEKPAP